MSKLQIQQPPKNDIVLYNGYMEEEDVSSLMQYLKLEWSIWSKCLGKVFVVNGTSSAGKTTFTKYLESTLSIKRISIDDIAWEIIYSYLLDNIHTEFSLIQQVLTMEEIRKILHRYKINIEKYNQSQLDNIENFKKALSKTSINLSIANLFDRMYDVAKSFIFSGKDVIVDTVMEDNDLIHEFSYYFRGYPILIMLLYSPLEKTLENCCIRNEISTQKGQCNYRWPSIIIDQYFKFYKVISNKDNSALGDLNIHEIGSTLDKIIKNVSSTIGIIIDSADIDKVLKREISGIEKVKSVILDNKLTVVSNTKYDVLVRLFNGFYTLSFTTKEEEYVQFQFGIDEISSIGALLDDYFWELL
jgi:dephospho-CoA kinase